jgi:putative salt-induced outer membrane protein YdiY
MLYRFAMAAVLCLVASVSRAESVALANGDRLNVEVVDRGVDHIVIEHPQLGQVRLSVDQLDIDTEDPPKPGIFGTNILRGWSRALDIGLNGRQGNSETTSITAGAVMTYEDEFTRWGFKGRSFYARDKDGVSDNDGRFTLRRDQLLPGSRWFAFGSVRYAYDRFDSWKHRIVTSTGPGYQLVQRKTHALDLRLGATFTREFGDRETDEADAMFAIDYSWEPSDRYTLTFANQLFAEIQPDAGEFRSLTIAEWKMQILKEPALSLKAGVENEYETNVEEDDKKNDLKYYVSVGIDF